VVTCVSFTFGVKYSCAGLVRGKLSLRPLSALVHVLAGRCSVFSAMLVVSWQSLAAVVIRPGSSSHQRQLLIGQDGLTFDLGGLLQGPVEAS